MFEGKTRGQLERETPFFVVENKFFGRLGERVFHFGEGLGELGAIFLDSAGEE